MKPNGLNRIRIISIFILIFALLIISRLYFLQIVNWDVYEDKANKQYSSTSKNIFNRGSIFFQNKDGSLVSAATLKSGFIITINPQILKDPEIVYQKVNEITPIDHDFFIAKASKKNDPYEEIAVRQDESVGKKISDLNISGLKVIKDRWRFYPGGKTAGHVIGILGYKGDEYAGRYGLERQFESQLVRKDGAYVNFFAQIFSDIKKVTNEKDSGEADIVTTIEPTIQTYFEKVLLEVTQKWGSDTTGGIIMNPKTGEIIAMEVYPSFDPNHPELEKSVSVFSNPLIENVYEMGSVIKPLTMLAGLDAGVITPKTTYYDAGHVFISGKKVSNFDGKERGVVGMQDVLSHSLNVGAAFIEKALGNKKFTDYMYSFGVGEKTGIDLPNEGRNLVDNLKSKIDVDVATASFGQGIALTPISTIRALSTVANGGYLVNPHVVKRVDYKIGFSKDKQNIQSKNVVKNDVAMEVARMMVYSVDHVLSAGSLKIPNYSVAAKTGTAQIAKPGGGGYYEDQFLHSFVGFFPAYDARFIIFFYTINPKGARFGSETLTTPFMDTVKFLINYYEVPPDR